MGLEELRIPYEHDSSCSRKNFTELNSRGVKTCLDCAGIFDAKGKGINTTDKRLDKDWVDPSAG